MSRTINGNLTGQARALDISDRKEIDYQAYEASLNPDASYWKNGALFAFRKLIFLVGRDKANEITGNWDDGRTWKEICHQTEELRRKYEDENVQAK